MGKLEIVNKEKIDKKDKVYTVTVIGSEKCGKTTVVNRFVDTTCNNDKTERDDKKIKERTIKILKTERGVNMYMRIFDLAGSDESERLKYLTIASSDFIILMYSGDDDYSSFCEARDTLTQVIKTKRKPDAQVILVQTKSDLNNSEVTEEEIATLKKELNALGVYKCSGQTGDGVKRVFDVVVKLILNSINKAQPKQKKKCCFCC